MPERGPGGAEGPRAHHLVLLYHSVGTHPGRQIEPFTVDPGVFAGQVDALLAAGYRCLTLSELLDAVPRAGGHRLAAVTFDDGYADFAEHALPALAERSVPSTLYATTGWLRGGGRPAHGPTDEMLAWSQLPELLAAGVEVGAHSHRHRHMDTLRPEAALDELLRPRRLLEQALQVPVRSFAYPHGYSSPLVRRLAREAGYDSAVGVRNALTHTGDDRYAVARVMLGATTSPEQFASWLDQRGVPEAATHELWRTRAWRTYRRGRALLRRAPGTEYR